MQQLRDEDQFVEEPIHSIEPSATSFPASQDGNAPPRPAAEAGRTRTLLGKASFLTFFEKMRARDDAANFDMLSQIIRARGYVRRKYDSFIYNWNLTPRTAKLFLGAVLIQITILEIVAITTLLASIGSSGCLSSQGRSTSCASSPIITSAFVFAESSAFVGYFAFSGVWGENIFELGTFLFASLLLTLFSIYNFFVPTGPMQMAANVIIVLTTVSAQLVYLATIWKVGGDFGWKMFLGIGANPEFQNMAKAFSIFKSAIKLDVQLAVTCAIVGGLFFAIDVATNIFNIIELILAFVFAWLGVLVIRNARRKLFILWSVLAAFEPAYVIYKIVLFFETNKLEDAPKSEMLILGLLTLIFRIFVCAVGGYCRSKFDKGFRELLDQQEEAKYRKDAASHITDLEVNPSPLDHHNKLDDITIQDEMPRGASIRL